MRARRSCLSVPGYSAGMLAKAATLPADEVVVDLEDSVAPVAKGDARSLVADALTDGLLEDAAVAVRVNAIDSPWFEDDVRALVAAAEHRLGSLVLPKVERPKDIERAAGLLDSLGDAAAAVGIQALVETAGGVLRAGEIGAASARLEALILGYADLAAALGRSLAGDSPERWLYAQDTVLVAARAAGIQAIDGPYLAIRDEPGLRLRAEHARALGFDGKWAVHPSQLPIINKAFTPGREEYERARAIVAALERAERQQRGVVELGGEMIDEASRKLALQLVARGRAAGLA